MFGLSLRVGVYVQLESHFVQKRMYTHIFPWLKLLLDVGSSSWWDHCYLKGGTAFRNRCVHTNGLPFGSGMKSWGFIRSLNSAPRRGSEAVDLLMCLWLLAVLFWFNIEVLRAFKHNTDVSALSSATWFRLLLVMSSIVAALCIATFSCVWFLCL